MKTLVNTIAIIIGAWSVSSFGYFWLGSVFDLGNGYNTAPFLFAAYYGFWSSLILWVFHSHLVRYADFSVTYEKMLWSFMLLFMIGVFLLLIFPQLPSISWSGARTPVEFFYANTWYFIPKTIEIIFQQILIAALVFALNDYGVGLLKLCLVTALLFGTFHLSLAFSYDNPMYVIRYSIAATIFGGIVPYLFLRVRNGFFISFAIHFGYYAIDAALIHFIFKSTE